MTGAWRLDAAYRTRPATPSAPGSLPGADRAIADDRAIAELAARQYGVVAHRQLRALGHTPSAVQRRVARGRLHRLHRGVFAVGHTALAAEGRWMAAVLACGPDAALSHRSAAAHWGLLASARQVIDVVEPRRSGRGLRGIDVHSGATLAPHDVVDVAGIPCTSVARTLLDLAEVLARRPLERACEQAEVLRLFDMSQVADVLARATGRRGGALLRTVLGDPLLGESHTRSELEERFLALCRAAGLPRPVVNEWIAVDGEPLQADFVWHESRLIAETDSHRCHGTRWAFERDRARDRRLLVAGWRTVRCTWRQVLAEPEEVAAALVALLGARPARGRAPKRRS